MTGRQHAHSAVKGSPCPPALPGPNPWGIDNPLSSCVLPGPRELKKSRSNEPQRSFFGHQNMPGFCRIMDSFFDPTVKGLPPLLLFFYSIPCKLPRFLLCLFNSYVFFLYIINLMLNYVIFFLFASFFPIFFLILWSFTFSFIKINTNYDIFVFLNPLEYTNLFNLWNTVHKL